MTKSFPVAKQTRMNLSRFYLLLTFMFLLLPCNTNAEDDAKARMDTPYNKWVVYYANELPSDAFEDYDLIVFDRDHHPSLPDLKAKGKTVLGYLSAGEIETYRPDYSDVKSAQVLLEENPNWPGHFAVDVRNPYWTKYLIEEVIPDIMQKGFHGIFVDTLDSVEDLEVRDPATYKGMIASSALMIKTIRAHYPGIKIMINRGFKVMPLIAEDVDYLLAEGILVNYDFKGGNHQFFPDEVYNEYVYKMLKLKESAPHLQIVTLDYWDMEDTDGVKEIYRRQHAQGFLPYVTTIELNRLHPEPK